MEERIIDKDELRKIKIKKNAVGGIEDATEEDVGGEEEVTIEIPDEEYDEDLVGLSPSQLQRELERREKAAQEARIESKKLIETGKKLLAQGEYREAEPFYAQAALYDPQSVEAKEGLWVCRTDNFKDLDCLYLLKNAREIAESDEKTRTFILEKVGERLKTLRESYLAQVDSLKSRVLGAKRARQEAFNDNRNYYLVRLLSFLAAFLVIAVAAGVSSFYIVRVNNATPIILVGVFGGFALLALCFFVFYLRKLIVANRLCRENEKLSSTEEGARLEELTNKLECLSLILEGERESDRDSD